MILKRFFDIFFSVAGFVILFPLFFLVTIAIKITMPGPILFKQTRIGFKGKQFVIYKFRTMVVNRSPVTVTLKNDQRITQLGKLLRKTKIDEFPQLWNILKGDMSFVGPRPDVPEYSNKLKGEDRLIFSVKPGITGLDSVKYPDEERILHNQPEPEKYYDNMIYPDKVRLNLIYVKHQDLWLDLRILLKTVFRQKFKEQWLN